MTIFPAIQSFVSANTSSASSNLCVPDWPNGKVYVFQEGSPFATSRFDFTSGVEEFTGDLSGTTDAIPLAIDNLGFLYVSQQGGNFCGISQLLASDFALSSTWGVSSITDNEPLGIPAPGIFTSVAAGDTNWLVTIATTPIGDQQHAISVLQIGSMLKFAGHHFTMDGGAWASTPGAQTANTAMVYTIASPSSLVTTPNFLFLYATQISKFATAYDPSTWPTQNPFITSHAVGTVSPAQIDPTWTHAFEAGIVYDATDGNVIASVYTDDSVATQNYVVKLRTTDATVLWKIPVPLTINGFLQMGYGRVQRGRLAVACLNPFTKQVFTIDTSTGAYTILTSGFAGLLLDGEQCFDDTSGAILGHFSFGQTTGSPTLLNETPTSFEGWAALYPAEPFTPPNKRGRFRSWGNYYEPRGIQGEGV